MLQISVYRAVVNGKWRAFGPRAAVRRKGFSGNEKLAFARYEQMTDVV